MDEWTDRRTDVTSPQNNKYKKTCAIDKLVFENAIDTNFKLVTLTYEINYLNSINDTFLTQPQMVYTQWFTSNVVVPFRLVRFFWNRYIVR